MKKILTEQGQVIFFRLQEHCQSIGLELDGADELQLMMLANSFDIYARAAEVCRESGTTQKPKDGGWDQLRPEYITMTREYANILKYGAKFGLNPVDRAKITTRKNEGTKKGFDLT